MVTTTEPTNPEPQDGTTQQPAVPNPAHHPIELPPEDAAILDTPVRPGPQLPTDAEGQ